MSSKDRDRVISTRTPYVPLSDAEIEQRKKALYLMLNSMGIILESYQKVTLQMVYATRLIPVIMIMSGVVIKKLADGYSYLQVTKRYPVSYRNVKTIVVRNNRQYAKAVKATQSEEKIYKSFNYQ